MTRYEVLMAQAVKKYREGAAKFRRVSEGYSGLAKEAMGHVLEQYERAERAKGVPVLGEILSKGLFWLGRRDVGRAVEEAGYALMARDDANEAFGNMKRINRELDCGM